MWASLLSDGAWHGSGPWLIPAIGLAAGGGALLLIVLVSSRSASCPPPATALTEKEPQDPFEKGSRGEKRIAARRVGNLIAVLLADPSEKVLRGHAWVLDRSVGGLGLGSPNEVAPGTVLSVRASNAPELVPWVQVEVRSCRMDDNGDWELGCRYVKTPSYDVLLWFG